MKCGQRSGSTPHLRLFSSEETHALSGCCVSSCSNRACRKGVWAPGGSSLGALGAPWSRVCPGVGVGTVASAALAPVEALAYLLSGCIVRDGWLTRTGRLGLGGGSCRGWAQAGCNWEAVFCVGHGPSLLGLAMKKGG